MDIIKSYNFPIHIEKYLIESYNKVEKDNKVNKLDFIYDLIYEYSEYSDSYNRWKNIKTNYDNC